MLVRRSPISALEFSAVAKESQHSHAVARAKDLEAHCGQAKGIKSAREVHIL